jgi:hypothetical protein
VTGLEPATSGVTGQNNRNDVKAGSDISGGNGRATSGQSLNWDWLPTPARVQQISTGAVNSFNREGDLK